MPYGAIAWAGGLGVGVALALALGPFGPGWGFAFAFPWLAMVFAIGSWIERDGEGMTHLLRLTLAVTAAFVVVTVPITSAHLERRSASAVGVERASPTAAWLDRDPRGDRRGSGWAPSPGDGAESPARAAAVLSRVAQLRSQLVLRWAVIGMGLPAGVAILLLRRGRRSGARATPP